MAKECKCLSSRNIIQFFPADIRDLYELLMRNDGYGAPSARFGHQMERKGGRSPTLRLRFGKRSGDMQDSGDDVSHA